MILIHIPRKEDPRSGFDCGSSLKNQKKSDDISIVGTLIMIKVRELR